MPNFSANCPPELRENIIAPYETLYVYIDKYGEVVESTIPPNSPNFQYTNRPAAPQQRPPLLQNQQVGMTRLIRRHQNHPGAEFDKYEGENLFRAAIHHSLPAETPKKDPPKAVCKNCIYVLDREIEGEHGYACYERSGGNGEGHQ
uniref:Uncharacterized protein n=1 Tax=Panagrellus redivivus TaxID=6233 RepID=A0A7E4W7R8_PANRE